MKSALHGFPYDKMTVTSATKPTLDLCVTVKPANPINQYNVDEAVVVFPLI